jgi:hypothetical protein
MIEQIYVLSRKIEMSAVIGGNEGNVVTREKIHHDDELIPERAGVYLGSDLALGPTRATVMAVLAD